MADKVVNTTGVAKRLKWQLVGLLTATVRVRFYTSLVPSPSYAKREKGSGQKGRTSTSSWNAIIGNSGVRKIETNRHFCTVCKGQALKRMRVSADHA